MTEDLSTMAFSAALTDPDEIEWQLSLGRTALDIVTDQEFAGMTAVEACLAKLCGLHAADSGTPSDREERSLRLLVEDALGSPSFQTELLPVLVKTAIEANNSFLVAVLLSYAVDEKTVLAMANAEEDGKAAGPAPDRA